MGKEVSMDIQIFDNGGKTPDRYCLIIDNRDVYTMGTDPRSHQSPVYLCHAVDLDREEAGKLIYFEDLPTSIKKTIELNATIWAGKVSGLNRRNHLRLHGKASVICRHFSKPITFTGRMLNFSKSGMYFESGAFIKEGTPIYFRLTDCTAFVPEPKLCEGLRSVSLAEVKWAREVQNKNTTCFGIGVKYF